MSVQAMSFVIDNSKQKGSNLLTLLMIANHAHADGTGSYPSIPTLAKETRMSERGVQYCTQQLKESGELLIFKDQGPRGVNLYQIPMTQSLRQSKNGMTQDLRLMTQDSPSRDAIAIAPESKNHHEPSPPSAVSIPISIVSQRLEDYYQRRYQTGEDGRKFLISPATGERVYAA